MNKRIATNSGSKTHSTEAEKMLTTKNKATIAGLIKGMQDIERVDMWIKTEAEGQGRSEVVGMLNRKKSELVE